MASFKGDVTVKSISGPDVVSDDVQWAMETVKKDWASVTPEEKDRLLKVLLQRMFGQVKQ